MAKYVQVGREVRKAMFALTPLVEPLSIDEAFLDLTGTERLHGMSAGQSAGALRRSVERDIGITVSIGLSANKFLAKIASDLDKPRGFAVLGQSEAAAFLAPKPVELHLRRRRGQRGQARRDGFRTIADLQRADEARPDAPLRRGRRAALAACARHRQSRTVSPERETKSMSAETTFERDIGEFRPLEQHLVGSDRARLGAAEGQGAGRLDRDAEAQDRRFQDPHAGALALALRRSSPRAFSLPAAICSRTKSDGTRFRLIGIGVSNLEDAEGDDLADLIDRRAAEAEHAVDRLRRSSAATRW